MDKRITAADIDSQTVRTSFRIFLDACNAKDRSAVSTRLSTLEGDVRDLLGHEADRFYFGRVTVAESSDQAGEGSDDTSE